MIFLFSLFPLLFIKCCVCTFIQSLPRKTVNVLAGGITLKYRYGGGPTFSQLHTDNAPPLGLFLWGRTAQREQGWWAQAGKAACL